jgi:purine-binding chemotaxis protein CheW
MEAQDRKREILVFTLGAARYALWSTDVRELIRAVAIVPLPRAPRIVEGVINLRGQIVPVLDLRARLGLVPKPLEPTDHFIVVSAGERLVAVRADRALSLVTVGTGSLDELQAAPFLAGAARLPDGLVLIHDLRTFLAAGETTELDGALSAAGGAA